MTTCLDDMPNAFDEVHRVRCFNHTLQLSAKALLKPFNAGMSSNAKEDELLDDAGNADVCFDELEDDDAIRHNTDTGTGFSHALFAGFLVLKNTKKIWASRF